MSDFKRFTLSLAGFATLALAATSAVASPYHLLLESRQDATAPYDVYMANFATLDDLRNSNVASAGYTQIDVAPSYQIVGFTYDGSYHLLLESRQDATAPYDVYMANFATLDDLRNSNVASAGYTQLDVAPGFQIKGLTYDGSYHLLLESRQDATAPYDVYMANFATLDDLRNSNVASAGYTQIDVAPGFEITDFTYDGSYHLLLESRQDATAPYDVYMANFATLDDLRNSNVASAGYTQIDVAPSYQIVGFTGEWLQAGQAVPEPATLTLVGLGLAGICFMRKHKSA